MERVADRLFLLAGRPRHAGASHAVCTELGIPLWVGENDADAMEKAEVMDRTLVAGDVLFNLHPPTGRPGLRPPPEAFKDTARNRESMRRLAELEPAVVCFDHGPPLRDRGALRAFVERREC